MPPLQSAEILKRVEQDAHPEFVEHRYRWQLALDSLEGGNKYRFATYGPEITMAGVGGTRFVTNLIRHPKELPPPVNPQNPDAISFDDGISQSAVDQYAKAGEDAFRTRQVRTPVPRLMAEAIAKHLARVYSKPIHREGPDALREFWRDVDGSGTDIDSWMAECVAEIYLALGQVDILFGHPAPPPGVTIVTEADQCYYRTASVLAQVVLPINVPWWRLDARGRYEEVIVREWRDSESGGSEMIYRHLTRTETTWYDSRGAALGPPAPHPFGRVPMVRVHDRKKVRCRNVGQSRYDGVLDIEREFYNESSELILSNTLQASPTLQGPKTAFMSNNLIEVGPSGILPIEQDATGKAVEWSYVSPPKEAGQFITQCMNDLVDRADRLTGLTKPAGVAASTTAQSGISKWFDQRDGNNLLGKISRSLRKLEVQAARMALCVATDGKFDPDAPEAIEAPKPKPVIPPPGQPMPAEDDANPKGEIEITYPYGFNLRSAEEIAVQVAELQSILDNVGRLPEFETKAVQLIARDILEGIDPDELAEIEAEIEAFVEEQAAARQQQIEAATMLDPEQALQIATSLQQGKPQNVPGQIQADQVHDNAIGTGTAPGQAAANSPPAVAARA